MHRILAIVERDLRKFFRNPALMVSSMIFPLMQLLVLGHAFGGKIRNLDVAVVDHDRGGRAREVRELLRGVESNPRTFSLVEYSDLKNAEVDLRAGRVDAVVHIPEHFSRDAYAGNRPRLVLVVDNTDNFNSEALAQRLAELVGALNAPRVDTRLVERIQLQVVETYGYVQYIKYLLPGTIAMSIFMISMIGGGIIFIDDKARGLHEGYLVTPIRRSELVLGLSLAGAVKGVLAGMVLVIIGGLIAGVEQLWEPVRLLYLMLVVGIASLALIGFTFLIMVRVEDPLVPRAVVGVLMTVLFFPSGAVYPVEGFPLWLKVISFVDPFTYAVHAFKSLLLKNTGFAAIYTDLLYLLVFAVVMISGSILLFRRTV
ncbi:MAG: ABC transporter permease [Acidobacteria bacterium]|nr:ABC transporter permease [Acidobacteriota bacterium]